MTKKKEETPQQPTAQQLVADPAFVATIAAHRAVSAEIERELQNQDRQRALHQHQPLLAPPDEDFESPEVIAASRSPRGFRRSGVIVTPEKTLIPAGTFRTKAAFDAFMNDANIIAVETGSKKASAALREGVTVADVPGVATLPRSTTAIGGALENATPEMLKAAEEGTLTGHPSFGAVRTHTVAPGAIPAPIGVASGAADIERVKMEREARKGDSAE